MRPADPVCLRCFHAEKNCHGPCACRAEPDHPVDLLERARTGKCPLGLFDHPSDPVAIEDEPVPEPLPRSQWPWIVEKIAGYRCSKDAGIGDTLQRAFSSLGADRVKDALKLVGIECGCDGRQAWFNARFPY